MSNLRLFIQGFITANRNVRMVIYLWLVNFLFSLMIITPFYLLLNKEFSRSLVGDTMTEKFDLTWLGDIVFKYKDIHEALLGWLAVGGIIYLLFHIFLNGGVIGRIVEQRERISLGNFFSDCGKFFWRFFRVFLISLIVYAFIIGIIYKLISSLFKLWTKNASTEWPLIISSNLKFLILIFLFYTTRMFFDYVRIRLVVEDSRRTIAATILNFSFIGKRFFKALFLYFLVGMAGIIFSLVYFGVSKILPSSASVVVIVFIWQQLYILSRMWVKILFFSTEYHFLAHHKASWV